MQIYGPSVLQKLSVVPPGSIVLAGITGRTFTCLAGKTNKYPGLFVYFCVPLDPAFGEPHVSPPIIPVSGDLPVVDVTTRFLFRPDYEYQYVSFGHAYVDGEVVLRTDGLFLSCPFNHGGVPASKVLVNLETGEISNPNPLLSLARIDRWSLAVRRSDLVDVTRFHAPPDVGGGEHHHHRSNLSQAPEGEG